MPAAFKAQKEKSVYMWVLRLDDKASTPDCCRSRVSRRGPLGRSLCRDHLVKYQGKKRTQVFIVITRLDIYGGVSEPR